MNKKSEIRAAVKKYLLSEQGSRIIQKAEKLQKDGEYCRQFLHKIPGYEKAKTVFAYYPLPLEFPTLGLLREAAACGKTIGLPIVAGKDLMFKKVNFTNGNIDSVSKGRFGILEPSEKAETLFSPDSGFSKIKDMLPLVILVPGRAFGKDGSRLGRGGGFYDRFFKTLFQSVKRSSVTLAGVCFSGQIAGDRSIAVTIPMEEFDYPVDVVLTEEL